MRDWRLKNMFDTKCFLLAAGNGSRLKPLTDSTPKPLLEIDGKPVIQYVVDNLRKHNVNNICINVHYKPIKLIEWANKENIRVYYEHTLKGTAGALIQAKEWVSEDFIVQNSDTLTNLDYSDMLAWHRENGSLVTIFTKHNAVHSGGTYIFNKEVFDYILQTPSSIHEDLVPYLVEKMPERVGLYNDPKVLYCDIGTFSGLARANREWKKYL